MTRSSSKFLTLGLAAAALVALTSTANAQDPEALRRRFRLSVPTTQPAGGIASFFRGSPGTNTGTPLAFGPAMGDVFIGAGYQNQIRTAKLANGTFGPQGGDDGSVSLGFGLGDATDGIGLTTVITSLSTFRSGFGNRTAVSFQVFRNINSTMAVALGVESAFISGGGKTDGSDSWYGVLSKVFQGPALDYQWLKAITLSGGIGNGRFRRIDDVRDDNGTVMAFGSLSALVHDQISVITDFTGQDLNIGVSFVPFKYIPIAITPALADLTGTASKSPRFILGVGLGLHF